MKDNFTQGLRLIKGLSICTGIIRFANLVWKSLEWNPNQLQLEFLPNSRFHFRKIAPKFWRWVFSRHASRL